MFKKLYVNNGCFALIFNKDFYSHLAYYKTYKIELIEDCINEDYKTFIAKKQKTVPKGTVFEEFEICENLYGTFFDVKFNNVTYSLKLSSCNLINKDKNEK